jgi:Flp pilus assembly protein TadG
MILWRLFRDRVGGVLIETAFTLPIMVMVMVALLQFSLVLQASGAMRHAIGQGIRYAKVNPLSDPDDPAEVAALKSDVERVTRNSLSGIDADGLKSIVFTTHTDSNELTSGTITIGYELTPVIPFMSLPPIQLSETRTAYLPA